MAFVTLENINMIYNRKNHILKDLNLNMEKGELISLLGPSGCGKTTTLRIVAGLLTQNSGKFLLDGEDMSRVPVYKRGFGMVFQSYALFPHLNVEENVAFGLKRKCKGFLAFADWKIWKNDFRKNSPEGKGKEWLWRERWLLNLNYCFWMNRSAILMRSCVYRCAWKSKEFSKNLKLRPSLLRMIRKNAFPFQIKLP